MAQGRQLVRQLTLKPSLSLEPSAQEVCLEFVLFGALVEEVVLVPLHRRTAPSSVSSPHHPSSTRLSYRAHAHAHAHPTHTTHHAPGRTRDAWSHSFLAPSLQAAIREMKRQDRNRSKNCIRQGCSEPASSEYDKSDRGLGARAEGGGELGCTRHIHNLAQFDQLCLSVVEHLAHSQFVLAPAQLGLLHPPHLSLLRITVLISRGSTEVCVPRRGRAVENGEQGARGGGPAL